MAKSENGVVELLAYTPRVLRLVWEASPRYALLTIVLTVLTAAVAPTQIWITKLVIDRIAAALGEAVVDWSALLGPVLGIFMVWVAGVVFQSLRVETNMLLAFKVTHRCEWLMLDKTAALDIAFYESPAFYDLLDNAKRDSGRSHNFAMLVLESFGSLLSLCALLGMLATLHPLAVLVLVLTAMPQMLAGANFIGKFYRLVLHRTPPRRMARYASGLLLGRDAVKEVRLFGLHGEFIDRYRRFWDQYFADEKALRLGRSKAFIGAGLVSLSGTAAIWGYAVMRAAQGGISLGDIAMAFQATEHGRGALEMLFRRATTFYEHLLFAKNLFDFLDLEPAAVEGALSRAGRPGASPRAIREGIEFRGVSFRYPGGERPVLDGLSFALKPGATVAVVGANGAGKTTLVKLLARFYDPTAGEIRVDGVDLRDIAPEKWQREIGVIFQDFARYDLSARENIGFGQVELVGDQDRIARAAEMGGAAPVVERLPDGFDTVLGRTFDAGVDLSGGEWQKVALSRAFMREAQVLILDEPTAALDALAEYEVYNRFAELTAGKTTVFISHRFSTVRMADHILVLEGGRLVEEGDHAALMGLQGRYAEMFSLQAERYK